MSGDPARRGGDPPFGLYTYLCALDEWVADKVVAEPVIRGIIATSGLGEEEAREFRAGRAPLHALVPPIGPTEIDDADLTPLAARSLALAEVLRGIHGLHWAQSRGPEAEVGRLMREIGEVANLLMLRMDDAVGGATSLRLRELQTRLKGAGQHDAARVSELREEMERSLQSGGMPAIGVFGQLGSSVGVRVPGPGPSAATGTTVKAPTREASPGTPGGPRTAVPAPPPPSAAVLQEQTVASAADSIRSTEGFGTVRHVARQHYLPWGGAIVLFGVGWLAFRNLSGESGPPAATEYSEVEVAAIIREGPHVVVRVRPTWIALPLSAREAGAKALFQRLAAEGDASIDRVELVTGNGHPLGHIDVGGLTWTAQ